MMRVITGVARGRKLETLPGEDVTRPTTESVKEAVFSMIQFEIEDKNVLDLFAGSGQLGIEKCLPLLFPMMSDDGIVICETSRDEDLPDELNGFYADRVRTYGKTKITLYRRGN